MTPKGNKRFKVKLVGCELLSYTKNFGRDESSMLKAAERTAKCKSGSFLKAILQLYEAAQNMRGATACDSFCETYARRTDKRRGELLTCLLNHTAMSSTPCIVNSLWTAKP